MCITVGTILIANIWFLDGILLNCVISRPIPQNIYKKKPSLNRSIIVHNNNFNTKINNFYFQPYAINVFSDLRQVGSFRWVLRFLSNKTDRHYIIDILFWSGVKHHWTQSFNVLYARNTWGKKQNGILCDEWILWRNIFNVLTYIKIRIRYII